MKIKSLGEFEAIERIRKRVPPLKNAIMGIGDDCAVLPYGKDTYLLVTADMLLDKVHFDLQRVSAFKVGRKALAVSLSDIAAMAGIPKYCLVCVGMPPHIPASFLDDFYGGLMKLAREFGVELVGGDTNRAESFVCDVCVIGQVEKNKLVRRSGAKVKDGIFVTGTLGGSIKGKQFDFTPRIKAARALVENFTINAMIDISDGLSSDLHHITDASNVGAAIDSGSVPLSQDARSRRDALSGGEDFELLFTAPAPAEEESLRRESGIAVKKIGEIRPRREGVTIALQKGKKEELKKRGYTHF